MKNLIELYAFLEVTFGAIKFIPSYKEKLNNHFLSFCQKSKTLNDDALILALRPFFFGFSLVIMLFTGMLIQLLGESDKDVKSLALFWLCTTAFSSLVLFTTKEFKKRLKDLFKNFISAGKWTFYIISGIVMLVFALKIITTGQFLPGSEIWNVITALFIGLIVALFAILGYLLITLAAIPFLIKKCFILFTRWIIGYITTKGVDDPTHLPRWILATILFLFGVTTYLLDKFN